MYYHRLSMAMMWKLCCGSHTVGDGVSGSGDAQSLEGELGSVSSYFGARISYGAAVSGYDGDAELRSSKCGNVLAHSLYSGEFCWKGEIW